MSSLTHIHCLRSIGDPLLCAVDNPELPILCLACGSLQPRNIRTSERLGDCQADVLLAGKHLLHDPIAQLWPREVEDWRQTDDHAAVEAVLEAAHTRASSLLIKNELQMLCQKIHNGIGMSLRMYLMEGIELKQ